MIFISQPRSVANDNHWVALGVTEQRAPLRRASAASTASVASGDGVEASVGRLNMLNHVFNSPDAEISSSRQRARSKYSPIRGQEPDVRLALLRHKLRRVCKIARPGVRPRAQTARAILRTLSS